MTLALKRTNFDFISWFLASGYLSFYANMDALQDEVKALEAIMLDDVTITYNAQSGLPEQIETTIFPDVEDESELKYICVTLQVIPSAGYPDVSPEFHLLRPRGLDDVRLEAIKTACTSKLNELVGYPVVFDLIEVVRDNLTGSNVPGGQCVICLYCFREGDDFSRTECFHYLHSYCLARHLEALRRNYKEEFDKLPAWQQKIADPFQASCPVCRERIKDDVDSLKMAQPPVELQNAPDFKVTRELRELQQRMAALFLQQKTRGAIIDVDSEVGPVISLETEAQMRRRLCGKQEDTTGAVIEGRSCTFQDNECSGSDFPSTATVPVEQQNGRPHIQPASTARGSQGVQSTQNAGAPRNNNYHHNRRNYRGGRRPQQQQPPRHRDSAAANQQQNTGASSSSAGATPPRVNKQRTPRMNR